MSSTIFRLGSFLCCSPSSLLLSFLACCSVSSQTLVGPCQPLRAFLSCSCLAHFFVFTPCLNTPQGIFKVFVQYLKTFTVSSDYCLLYSGVTWVSASSEEASDLCQLPSPLLFDMGWILRNEIVCVCVCVSACVCVFVCTFSHSVVSDSLQPHGL